MIYSTDMAMIIEKILKISPDYQYMAIRSKNFLQANWHKNKFYVLEKLLQLNKNSTVLDLGTGSGNFELMFHKKCKSIVGVDYNDEAIKFLKSEIKKEKIKNVATYVSDIRKINKIQNIGKFNVVIMMDVIEHVGITDAKKLIKNLKPHLEKNTKILITTPNYWSTWFLLEKILDRVSKLPKMEQHQHISKYNFKNIREVFPNKDFKTIKISSFNLFSYLFPVPFISKLLVNIEMLLPLYPGNLLVTLFEYVKD